jgi:hypothetical protein
MMTLRSIPFANESPGQSPPMTDVWLLCSWYVAAAVAAAGLWTLPIRIISDPRMQLVLSYDLSSRALSIGWLSIVSS